MTNLVSPPPRLLLLGNFLSSSPLRLFRSSKIEIKYISLWYESIHDHDKNDTHQHCHHHQHDNETNQGIFLSSSLLLSSPLLPIPELGGVGLLFHINILFVIIVSFFRIQLDKQPLQLSSWWSWSSWSSSSSWLSWSSLTYWRLSFSGRACSGCCTCSSPGYFFSSAFLYSSP